MEAATELLAFQALQLPFCNRRVRQAVKCTDDAPKARRLSLPTNRERRYLHENFVARSSGKARYFVRAAAFSLSVWPLTMRELTTREQEGRERWLRYQARKKLADESANCENALVSKEQLGINFESEVRLDAPSDSLLSDSTNEETAKSQSDLARSLLVDFQIPPWAYIVRVRVSKAALGKRAVQRNRAKRRVKAAASQIFPNHALRGMEYVLNVVPEALTIDFQDLLHEVRVALKKSGCWKDQLTLEMLTREKYCSR